MNPSIKIIFMVVLACVLLYSVNAEASSISMDKREAEINGLIKGCVGQKEMRPEATIQLQNPTTSSLAQPTVSTLAQPHETLTMAGILDYIKATANIATPDEQN